MTCRAGFSHGPCFTLTARENPVAMNPMDSQKMPDFTRHGHLGHARLFSGMFQLLWLLMLGFAACAGMACAESGIVVWKEQRFHNDDRARAFVFDDMRATPEITWFSKGSQRMGFEKHQFFQYLLLPPSLPAELAEPEQLIPYRQQFAESNAFAKRFPSAARILKPQLDVMKDAIADFEAGQVYFSGEWMPRADYESKVAARDKILREKAARREAERLEAERKRQAMERKEGLRYAYAYGSGLLVFLILLVTSIVRRMGRLLVSLILAPMLAAGWMTYQHGSYSWIKQHAEKISRAWKSADAP